MCNKGPVIAIRKTDQKKYSFPNVTTLELHLSEIFMQFDEHLFEIYFSKRITTFMSEFN